MRPYEPVPAWGTLFVGIGELGENGTLVSHTTITLSYLGGVLCREKGGVAKVVGAHNGGVQTRKVERGHGH